MSGRLIMKLFDEDKINDEIVGSIIFNLKDVIGDKNGKFFWKNIYGSPLDVSGENTNLMNNNPEMASTWKGRVLMQVTAEKTDKPEIKVQDVDEISKDLAFPYM
jgi:nitrous oxide reductase